MSVAEIGAVPGLRSERAALRRALRSGDALNAARAWERLRVVAQSISIHERAAGREARKAVGRAIRDARYRRLQSAMDAFAPAPAAEAQAAAARSRLRPIALAIAVLAVISLLIGYQVTRPEEDFAPAAAAPEQVTEPTAAPTPNAGGRGRTRETPAPVAIATPAPVATAEPTAAPSPSASAATGRPGATSAAGAQPGGVAGGVTGGVVGGTVGGTVGGVVGGTGTKTIAPTPTPYVLPARPPALAPGADRFMFVVIDQATGVPLGGVCVNYGFAVCSASDPHTNASGQYWLDLNPGMATSWNFRFFNDGYLTATLNKTYRPGMGTSTTTVFLRHT
jgi:hypothetical protein